MEELKEADVVRLKSGGPHMTIEKIIKNTRGVFANVVYFDGVKLEKKGFEIHVLEKIEEKSF